MPNEIQVAIEQHKLDKQIASFSPNYDAYLKMEDELKTLDNAINSSKDILQRNKLETRREKLESSLIEFLTKWSNS